MRFLAEIDFLLIETTDLLKDLVTTIDFFDLVDFLDFLDITDLLVFLRRYGVLTAELFEKLLLLLDSKIITSPF